MLRGVLLGLSWFSFLFFIILVFPVPLLILVESLWALLPILKILMFSKVSPLDLFSHCIYSALNSVLFLTVAQTITSLSVQHQYTENFFFFPGGNQDFKAAQKTKIELKLPLKSPLKYCTHDFKCIYYQSRNPTQPVFLCFWNRRLFLELSTR